MPEDQVKIKKESSPSDGLECCSDDRIKQMYDGES